MFAVFELLTMRAVITNELRSTNLKHEVITRPTTLREKVVGWTCLVGFLSAVGWLAVTGGMI